MTSPTASRRPRAYVLLEALTASVVIAITLGTLFDVISYGQRMILDATRRTQAMRAAQAISERERNKDYVDLASIGAAPVTGVPNMTAQVVVSTLTHTDGGFTYAVKNVEVVVHYTYRGQPTELHVSLLRSK